MFAEVDTENTPYSFFSYIISIEENAHNVLGYQINTINMHGEKNALHIVRASRCQETVQA